MKQYFTPFLRWWWLILICTVAAGAASYLAVRRLPAQYEVHAMLVTGRSMSSTNPNSGELYLEQQLAMFYANIGNQDKIAVDTMTALKLQSLPQHYVRAMPNSPFVEVIVTDTDPSRAQAVTNELANQLVLVSPSAKGEGNQAQQTFIIDQLSKIQEQLKETEKEIADAQTKLGELTSARQIADTQSLISALQQKQISLQGNYANLLASSQQGAINSLTIVQPAALPTTPVGPNKRLYVLIAAAVGLLLSSAGAFAIEFLDRTIKTSEEAAELIGAPVIGYIPHIQSKSDPYTFTINNPQDSVTDAFRTLRTNLDFIDFEKKVKTIMVTATDASIGKTIVASNLALNYVLSDKDAVIIDCDLRRPMINKAFQLENSSGLTDICRGQAKISDTLISWVPGTAVNRDDKNGGKPNETSALKYHPLRILPSGTIPPNPSELLASQRFSDVLSVLSRTADVVIIDSPPLFIPDTSILLGKVDGVIVVVQLGKSMRDSIRMVKETISRSGAPLLGIVVNRIPRAGKYYYYDSGY